MDDQLQSYLETFINYLEWIDNNTSGTSYNISMLKSYIEIYVKKSIDLTNTHLQTLIDCQDINFLNLSNDISPRIDDVSDYLEMLNSKVNEIQFEYSSSQSIIINNLEQTNEYLKNISEKDTSKSDTVNLVILENGQKEIINILSKQTDIISSMSIVVDELKVENELLSQCYWVQFFILFSLIIFGICKFVQHIFSRHLENL